MTESMNNISFEEMICFSKVFSVFAGMASSASVTNQEREFAYEAMKKLADNRADWTQKQKDIYKALADIAKEQGK